MRAISLTQPWATLVAIGAKRVETRSWKTSYRGELFIHAAQRFPKDARALCYREPFVSALVRGGFNTPADLPTGAILARTELTHVWSTLTMEFVHAMRGGEPPDGFDNILTKRERAFGDYSAGRFAWVFHGTKRLREPVPCKGALGLWRLTPELLRQLDEALCDHKFVDSTHCLKCGWVLPTVSGPSRDSSSEGDSRKEFDGSADVSSAGVTVPD